MISGLFVVSSDTAQKRALPRIQHTMTLCSIYSELQRRRGSAGGKIGSIQSIKCLTLGFLYFTCEQTTQ
jgi:hypothetical protein